MCGVAGYFNRVTGQPPERPVLENMITQLHHRGPDDYGYYIDGAIGLAHARLSIIDLAGGKQPIHNEDKSIWVVFNGEIFNYLELRSDLIAAGHRFYTESDTEVIVHAYEEYGEGFVDRLNGQFAIALWDGKTQQLYLYRDRIGIVPLFYTEISGGIVFASEVKSLLQHPDVSAEVNTRGLNQLFTFWACVPGESVFNNVKQVRPGDYLVVSRDRISVKTYWQWLPAPAGHYETGSDAEISEQISKLLEDAVRIRLRADVDVGSYLSGGLDSSILATIIKDLGISGLNTFSIGFSDRALDESSHQQVMADALGTRHSTIVCREHDIARNIEKTIWHAESPILRTAPVPMGLLSGLARSKDYRVVLTGEGADEVFGGYDLFKEGKIRHFWAKNPASRFRPLLLKRLYPYLELSRAQGISYLKKFFGIRMDDSEDPFFSHYTRWNTTEKIKDFMLADNKMDGAGIEADFRDSLPGELAGCNYFNKAQYVESRGLMAGYLLSSQGDRMLMMNSVEGRFPFLDHRVIEFANRLDPRQKMRVLNEKFILKQAFEKRLPPSITRRFKQPYRAPDIDSFYKDGKLCETADKYLNESAVKKAGLFDPPRVATLLRKAAAGRAKGYKDNMAFIGILTSQIWHEQFIA
jgi:asparagine synthase (glutamine-hydrolysing)